MKEYEENEASTTETVIAEIAQKGILARAENTPPSPSSTSSAAASPLISENESPAKTPSSREFDESDDPLVGADLNESAPANCLGIAILTNPPLHSDGDSLLRSWRSFRTPQLTPALPPHLMQSN